MRRVLPYYVDHDPAFPRGLEHRKHWEFAQVAVGLEQLGALGSEALVLAVGAGHEGLIFDLTTRVRWVFATDIYGAGSFISNEADARILLDPEYFVLSPYNRNRLVVEQMDALDLRFDVATFDAVYSLSSIEHFGAMESAKHALGEMARVLKPGGIAALTTECIVNDRSAYSVPGQELFTPDALRSLCSSQEGLVPVQELDFSLSERTRSLAPVPLVKAIEDTKRRHIDYPHILLELEGRIFTSFSVFLRKSTR
jgi:SAM-dependent methyltransferase